MKFPTNIFDFKSLNKVYLSPKLSNLPHDRELLLVAYGITDSYSISLFKSLWAKFDSSKKAVGRDEKSTRKVEGDEVGGAITLIDLNLDSNKSPEVLAELDIKNPIGLYYNEKTDELLVGSSFEIYIVSNGKIEREINNNLFSAIHSIKKSPHGIYVVSTATDSIIELNPKQPREVIWDWIASEHGYTTSPKGEKVCINRVTNYKKIGAIGSSHHATHINGVESYDENTLLATLFHQDQLIKIDKRTGDSEIVLDGIINPHGIHRRKEGFIVSDTRGNRVVLLSNDLKVVDTIEADFDWVQDAIDFGDSILVANDNKGRIDIFNHELDLYKQFSWDNNQRMISGLYKIKVKQALNVFSSR